MTRPAWGILGSSKVRNSSTKESSAREQLEKDINEGCSANEGKEISRDAESRTADRKADVLRGERRTFGRYVPGLLYNFGQLEIIVVEADGVERGGRLALTAEDNGWQQADRNRGAPRGRQDGSIWPDTSKRQVIDEFKTSCTSALEEMVDI